MMVAALNTAMPGNSSDESPMGARSFLRNRTSFTIRGTDQLCQPSVTVEDRQAVLSAFTSLLGGPKRAESISKARQPTLLDTQLVVATKILSSTLVSYD